MQRVHPSSLTFRIRRVCCHSNETRVPIANPPTSAQLGGTSTIPQSYIWVRPVVWECGKGQTDTHADTQTAVASDHNTFCLAMPNAIFNYQ